jgi:glutathione S-transferase
MSDEEECRMIRVLGRQTSGNVQKVLFALEEAGVPYVREDYGRQFNNTTTPDYRALNPNAKVPTLVDGDTVIWESHTILRYIAATRAKDLTGATPAEASAVERWMDWLLAQVNALYLTLFKDSKKPEAERVSDYAAQAKEMATLLALADAHLGDKTFFALERLTLADIALAPILKRCLAFPIALPPMPNLDAWMARMESRSAFAAATSAPAPKTASAA